MLLPDKVIVTSVVISGTEIVKNIHKKHSISTVKQKCIHSVIEVGHNKHKCNSM